MLNCDQIHMFSKNMKTGKIQIWNLNVLVCYFHILQTILGFLCLAATLEYLNLCFILKICSILSFSELPLCSACWLIKAIITFSFFNFFFYCCSSTVFSIPSPSPPPFPPAQSFPLPAVDPSPFWFCQWVLYTYSWKPFPLFLHYLLSPPHWLMSVCS